MVTALDTKLVPRIKDLLLRFGKDAVFTVHGTQTYDPTQGNVTVSGTQTFTNKITPPQNYEDRYIDGDLVQVGDVKVFLAAKDLEFTPIKGIQVDFDGTTWKIVRITPIYTGELIGLYQFQMRQ